MLDRLRERVKVIRGVILYSQRHRTELQQQLQEFQQRTTSGGIAQLQSQSPGNGPVDPCLEQQNAVDASLAEIAALNAQLTALEETLALAGDLLLERLAILEACRLEHPEYDPNSQQVP